MQNAKPTLNKILKGRSCKNSNGGGGGGGGVMTDNRVSCGEGGGDGGDTTDRNLNIMY